MVKCCLLTGATGLLGRHLLYDLTAAGVPLAVLARRGRLQPARDRVEAIMALWESRRGHLLPRPAVLEGDLHGESLGLDAQAAGWVAAHCDSVLHSAASMSFVADETSGEPRRTNVEGLARLLEFCRRTGIRRFHHVSTAYICGLREGRVLESELDQGQPLGNVYEESKLAAEKMLRGARLSRRANCLSAGQHRRRLADRRPQQTTTASTCPCNWPMPFPPPCPRRQWTSVFPRSWA